MSLGSKPLGSVAGGNVTGLQQPVSFGERMANSGQFDRLFNDGMALVERTAAYLDGEGRGEARKLKPPLSITYATESMRLTTRLLELASWLLIRRSLKNGEMSREDASAKRSRLKLSRSGRPSHIAQFEQLPSALQRLIEESFQLGDRVAQLDKALETEATAGVNAVAEQQARLENAFRHGLTLVTSR